MSMGAIDFSIPPALAAAAIVTALFPLILAATQASSRLGERHAARFTASALLCLGAWLLLALILSRGSPSAVDVVTGFCFLSGALIFYLQVWSLMTRGYTLAILLTLQKAGRPLTDDEIFAAYRGGDGLGWIMRHRLGGLIGAGLVTHEGDRLRLQDGRGVQVVRLYRLAIAVLGLRRTG